MQWCNAAESKRNKSTGGGRSKHTGSSGGTSRKQLLRCVPDKLEVSTLQLPAAVVAAAPHTMSAQTCSRVRVATHAQQQPTATPLSSWSRAPAPTRRHEQRHYSQQQTQQQRSPSYLHSQCSASSSSDGGVCRSSRRHHVIHNSSSLNSGVLLSSNARHLHHQQRRQHPFKLYDPKRIRKLVFATPGDTFSTATRGKCRRQSYVI